MSELEKNGIVHGDLVRITRNPGWSTIDRTGWIGVVHTRFDEKRIPYLAVLDKKGASEPLSSYHTKVANLGDLEEVYDE